MIVTCAWRTSFVIILGLGLKRPRNGFSDGFPLEVIFPRRKIIGVEFEIMRLLTANKASFSRGSEVLKTFIGLSNGASKNLRVCGQCRYNSSVAGLFTYKTNPSISEAILILFR